MNTRRFFVIIGSILLLFCVFFLYSNGVDKAKKYENREKEIDCQKSVENYAYRTREKGNNRQLKNLSYTFWNEVTVPGMPSSNEEDLNNNKIFSTSQCPQGMCLTDEYLLLTSYSEGEDELGELFVFDRNSGEYLVTLGMNPKSHLGGIAFDGENIWICNSDMFSLERISYDFVCLMAQQNVGQVVDASTMVDTFSVDNQPSCITFYDGRLWIATHSVKESAYVTAYLYESKKNQLQALNSYKIPKKVQGIAFDEEGHVFLSTSYGRTSSSYLKIYNSIFEMAENMRKPQIQVEMPPESEEIVIYNDEIYLLFESAAEKYYLGTDGKGVSRSPIDKILIIKEQLIS